MMASQLTSCFKKIKSCLPFLTHYLLYLHFLLQHTFLLVSSNLSNSNTPPWILPTSTGPTAVALFLVPAAVNPSVVLVENQLWSQLHRSLPQTKKTSSSKDKSIILLRRVLLPAIVVVDVLAQAAWCILVTFSWEVILTLVLSSTLHLLHLLPVTAQMMKILLLFTVTIITLILPFNLLLHCTYTPL